MVKKHFSVLDKNAQNLYFLLLFLFILYFDIIFALFLSQWPKSLLMAVKASKYPFFSFQTENISVTTRDKVDPALLLLIC